MGRRVTAVPLGSKEPGRGIPYVVNVDLNRVDWIEWRKLKALEAPTTDDKFIITQLEIAGADRPFWVLLQPYTGGEYNAAWSESEFTDQRIVMENENGVQALKPLKDPTTMAKLFGEECVRKHVVEVHNYEGLEVKNENGSTIPTGKVITPTNGNELVDFVTEHAWNCEYHILEDIFTAMQSESHLEAGLGEGLSSPLNSPVAATLHSLGGAESVNQGTPLPKKKPRSQVRKT